MRAAKRGPWPSVKVSLLCIIICVYRVCFPCSSNKPRGFGLLVSILNLCQIYTGLHPGTRSLDPLPSCGLRPQMGGSTVTSVSIRSTVVATQKIAHLVIRSASRLARPADSDLFHTPRGREPGNAGLVYARFERGVRRASGYVQVINVRGQTGAEQRRDIRWKRALFW